MLGSFIICESTSQVSRLPSGAADTLRVLPKPGDASPEVNSLATSSLSFCPDGNDRIRDTRVLFSGVLALTGVLFPDGDSAVLNPGCLAVFKAIALAGVVGRGREPRCVYLACVCPCIRMRVQYMYM